MLPCSEPKLVLARRSSKDELDPPQWQWNKHGAVEDTWRVLRARIGW